MVLVPEQQILMPCVLKCDVDGVRHILHQLENDLSECYFYLFSVSSDQY